MKYFYLLYARCLLYFVLFGGLFVFMAVVFLITGSGAFIWEMALYILKFYGGLMGALVVLDIFGLLIGISRKCPHCGHKGMMRQFGRNQGRRDYFCTHCGETVTE